MWGFTKFIFKQILKVSAFYLEKQKSFIPKKNIFLAVFSKHAKIIPKDGASRLNFPKGFGHTAKPRVKVQVCERMSCEQSKMIVNIYRYPPKILMVGNVHVLCQQTCILYQNLFWELWLDS